MGEKTKSVELTPEEIEAAKEAVIVAELEAKIKELEARESALAGFPIKVHIFRAKTPETGEAVAFVKEPTLSTKKAALDIMTRSQTGAADIIIETSILREDSDPRFFASNNPQNHPLILGLGNWAHGLIMVALDQQKKS